MVGFQSTVGPRRSVESFATSAVIDDETLGNAISDVDSALETIHTGGRVDG